MLKRRRKKAAATSKPEPPKRRLRRPPTPQLIAAEPATREMPAPESSADAAAETTTPEVLAPIPVETRAPRARRRKRILAAVASMALIAALVIVSAESTFGAPPNSSPAATPHGTGQPFLGSTQGCDTSFWADPSNYGAWEEYTPDQKVGTLFVHAGTYSDLTFADALSGQTSGEELGRTLIRAGVTAALNAANDSLAFPYARYQTGVDGRPALVPTVNQLLTAGSADQTSAFISDLTAANQLGCPL